MNGGHVVAREKWWNNIGGVNQYKYLGAVFSTGLTFLYALTDMAKRARNCVLGILSFYGH